MTSLSDTTPCNHTQILNTRNKHLPPNLHLSYNTQPLHITHAQAQYMYTCDNKQYLDCYNNVAHVGHSNEYIASQVTKQLSLVNTNTRYLDSNITEYVSKLISYMPNEFNVVYLVNSGSEANELALRLAHCVNLTATEYITVDTCYYGNTQRLIDLSPYKFNGAGGEGQKEYVHVAELPDMYRGRYTDPDTAGELYAQHVQQLLENIHSNGKQLCAFLSESLLSCGGQIVLPHDYLSHVYKYVRAAGGICIADEVQTALGRTGTFCCFQQYTDCCPDMVTFGKGIGNGFPLGAVITTKRIADKFNNGMEYFNTTGGSTLSCVVGLAVLHELERNHYMQHAVDVGNYLMNKLKELTVEHRCIGDIRGLGLMIGIEFVHLNDDFDTDSTDIIPKPDAKLAKYCVDYVKRYNSVLCGTDGPHHNVIKIKPPMCFNNDNADTVLKSLTDAIISYENFR